MKSLKFIIVASMLGSLVFGSSVFASELVNAKDSTLHVKVTWSKTATIIPVVKSAEAVFNKSGPQLAISVGKIIQGGTAGTTVTGSEASHKNYNVGLWLIGQGSIGLYYCASGNIQDFQPKNGQLNVTITGYTGENGLSCIQQ